MTVIRAHDAPTIGKCRQEHLKSGVDLDRSLCATLMEEGSEEVAEVVIKAREALRKGNAFKALEHVVLAIQKTRGEGAILQVLDEAKKAAKERGYMTEEEFAELNGTLEGADATEEPIISERGKEQILRDAYADGSSILCKRCGALVPVKRKSNHDQFWCEAL